MLNRVVRPLTVFVERFYPDPFVFVVLLSLLTFVLAVLFTDAGPVQVLSAWGDGLPRLLAFTAQLSITLLAAHALAHTDAIQSLLARLGRVPNTAKSAYALVVFCAGVGSLLAWSLGLIVGATVARQVAIETAKKGLKVHYPLLVASAYAGFVLWHMGYSSSAGLFVATAGHSLQDRIGVLAITDTIFTWQNAMVAAVALLVITVLCPLMRPKNNELIAVDPALLQNTDNDHDLALPQDPTPAQRLDNTALFSRLLGLSLLAYIGLSYFNKGFFLTLDIVNWSFLGLGLLLARSLLHYVRLINNAGAVVGAILIQYPFYAGILGMMTDTGLVEMLSHTFVSIASKETLSLYAFLSAGVVNMFIPSGGAQWVIQGPIFIDAAQALGVAPAEIVLAVAYGDQWTNMIQPFWTIPLLAIAGLHMRQIMGYAFIIFIATMLVFAGGLYFLGPTL